MAARRKPGFALLVRLPWLTALTALVLWGCGRYPQSTFDPQGPVARKESELFNMTAIIVAIIGLVVTVLLVYIVLRYRDRGTGETPPQVKGNRRLQILWTLIPIAFVLYKAVPTVADAFWLAQPPADAIKITAIGHQWWWEFQYPDLGITTANEMHIPAGKAIDLTVTSADVIHGFWVPRLAGKVDAFPDRKNKLWLQADQADEFLAQCTEFCGTSHANMHFKVISQSPADYAAWVQRLQELNSHPVQPTSDLARAGMDLFMGGKRDNGTNGSCYACHSIGGTKAQGKVGPNLTGVAMRTTVVTALYPNSTESLTRWLHDPPGVKPGVIMPNLHLSDKELQELVAFLQSQK